MSSNLHNSPERLAAIGESIAELMHDLRSPLTTIIGLAELISLEPEAERRRHMFEELGEQVALLTELSSETLAYARGECSLLQRRVHLYQFAHTVEARLAHAFEGTSITPTVHARYRGPARFDHAALLRVTDNLARNAREAMKGGRGTRFEVTIERVGDELVLGFADDGPGIPPSIQEQLFQPFHASGQPGGTGLGLAIVKKAVEDHGGRVSLATGASGTVVEARLPVHAD